MRHLDFVCTLGLAQKLGCERSALLAYMWQTREPVSDYYYPLAPR